MGDGVLPEGTSVVVSFFVFTVTFVFLVGSIRGSLLGMILEGEEGVGETKIKRLLKNVLEKCCCKKLDEEATRRERRSFISATATYGAQERAKLKLYKRNDMLGDVELASVAAVNDGVRHCLRRGKWLKRYSVEYGREYFEDTETGHTVWQLPDNATVVQNSSENFIVDNPILGSSNARNLPSSSSSESDTE